MGFGVAVESFSPIHNFKCFSSPAASLICTISPASSIARYHASWPCVIAHAWRGECQPGIGWVGFE